MEQGGLSTIEAGVRLKRYGLNDIAEQKRGIVKKFLTPLYSPISFMLLGAAFLSLFNGKILIFILSSRSISSTTQSKNGKNSKRTELSLNLKVNWHLMFGLCETVNGILLMLKI